MLVGEYQHNIDAKGRMILPAKFREELGEGFVMTKGLDGCLWIHPAEEWAKLDEQLSALPLSKGKDIQRFFYGGMTECEFDKQGRVLVTQGLREFAKLEKDVVVIGLKKRLEIWDKNEWNKRTAVFMENSDDVALQMEDLGI